MAKSFLETIKDDRPIFFINAICGLGDIVSHLSRLPAVKEKYPNHTIVFLLGGFGRSPRLMKEMIERQGELALIIKNYIRHTQHDKMEEFIKKSYVKESRGDIYETWSYCKEIFSNERPNFFNYPMAFPYTYNTVINPEKIDNFYNFVNSKTVIIKPFTTEGNPEGFQHDVDNDRFWKTQKWIYLIEKLVEDGYDPVFVGLEKDLQDVPQECDKKGIKYIDLTGLTVEETILIINNSNGCITTNSWEWGIAARTGIPTVCTYLKNHFFIPVHIPQSPSPIWNNLYIETNPLEKEPESAQDIFDKFKYITDYNLRPDVKYSIAMITLDDVDCVEDTLENVASYVPDDFVIVDGGSTDGTLEILKDWEGISLLEKKWEDDFALQKNFALENTKHEWRILIDADEQYEHIFWNQLPWYIFEAEKNGTDCINIPRINIVDGLTPEYVEKNGWKLSHFNWINYPDYQQRLYKRNCTYVGRTHERIVGAEETSALVGQHIIHRKSMKRQDRGLQREHDQFQIEAEIVKKNMDVSPNKKVIMQYLHDLGDSRSMRGVSITKLESIFRMMLDNSSSDEFHFVLAFPAHGDTERESFVEDIFGKHNIIRFGSMPELIYIIREINPYIMHMHIDGNIGGDFIKVVEPFVNHIIPESLLAGKLPNEIDYKEAALENLKLYRSK